MGVLHSGLFDHSGNERKAPIKSQFIWGLLWLKLKTIMVAVFCSTKLNNKFFGPLKKLEDYCSRLRPCQIWSKRPMLTIF